MPGVGDELHHYGWQTCSSAFDCCELERCYLVVPGFRSSRVHIVDVATDPRDFHPARAHEIHLPGGDPTTEISG